MSRQTAIVEPPGLTTNRAPFIDEAQQKGEIYIRQPYELYSDENHEAWRRLFARMEDGSLTDMGLTAAQHVTDELCGAFGGRWAGFAVSVSPMGARFKTIADITLKPNWEGGAALPFKIIPIVMAYGTDKFVDHYLLAVIAAQATREQVETTVVQPYR